jgi:hypothetical protein
MLFILAYNLGNFMRKLALLESLKRWSLTSVQTRLIKIGGRLVRHAKRLVFQLAEVMVTRVEDRPTSSRAWVAELGGVRNHTVSGLS